MCGMEWRDSVAELASLKFRAAWLHSRGEVSEDNCLFNSVRDCFMVNGFYRALCWLREFGDEDIGR